MAATVRFPTRPLSIAHHLLCPALHDLTLWLYVLCVHHCVVNVRLSSVLLTWQRSIASKVVGIVSKVGIVGKVVSVRVKWVVER